MTASLIKRSFASCGLLLLMLGTFGTACRRTPAVDKKASAFSKAESEAPQNLILKKGMRIKLRQLEFVDEGKLIPSEQEHGWVRTLSVENPSGAEGLSFQWHLAASVPAPETGSRFNASGKMTLANLVGARRMTLPLFWPGGELFLSNSSAIWLSDEAFAELQKQGKTAWSLGLVDNALLGPAQGLAFLESSLENVQRSLESKPDEKAAAGELSITDKSVDFHLKVNGAERKVEAIEAGNGLAKLKILKNPQNPLILEVEVAPDYSPVSNLFFPLSWTRNLLNYRVEEIDIP